MSKLIKNIILGASSLMMIIGGVNISFRSESTNEDVLITQKNEATHTSNYDSYTYTGDYYSSIDISNLTNGITGSLRNQLTDLIYPAGWHKYDSDDSGSLSYKLQEADEDPNNSSNMIYFYTRISVTKSISDGGKKWNREHVWPQSLSNDHWGKTGPGADIYHIRPVYGSINSSRSNTPFGEISSGTTKTYNNMTYGYVSGDYFEPLAANKGDIARILMYIYVAYYDYCGSDRPDLTKVIESYDTLLTWHTNDKPDKLEGNRNNYVSRYTDQKNRNPFVDHPEYAWHIFGSKCSSSVLSACKAAYPDETTSSSGGTSGGTTSGGTNTNLGADLASKKATYTITSTSAVSASGNIPTGSSATYSSTYGYKYQLTSGNSMTLTLSNYTNMILKGLTFSMKSNKSAGSASLKVLAGTTQLKNMQAYSFSDDHWYGAFSQEYVNVGINLTEKDHVTKDSEDITITVTSTENSVYVQSITVGYEVASTLSSITLSGMTTEFNVGDTFVFDGECRANYTTGETKVVTPTSISKPDMSTSGSKIVTVTYTEGTKTVSKNYTINVKATTVTPPDITDNYYQKVESTPSTLAGTYLIVCEASNVAFNGDLTSLDAAGNNIGITITNNKVASTSSIDAATFTISNNGTIKSKSGYYIGQTSDANGLASSTSNSYSNTITITNGDADIISSGGAYLRYNSSSNNLRFRYYRSGTYTAQKAIQLYKLVDGSSALTSAKAWANTFLSSITCNNGVTKPSVSNWNTQATSYKTLSDEAKTIFIEAKYIRSGSTVTPTNNTDSVIANAVARYDYIVEKYGEATYQAFITNRTLLYSLKELTPVIINNIDPFFLITTISVLGVSIILVIKKIKEE